MLYSERFYKRAGPLARPEKGTDELNGGNSVDKIIEVFNYQHLIFFIFVSVTAVSLSLFLCIKLGDMLSAYIQYLDYNKLSWLVMIFMSFIVILFTLMEHANILFVMLVYATSIALGLLPHYLGINKSNLMGVLIVPAIVIYIGIAGIL